MTTLEMSEQLKSAVAAGRVHSTGFLDSAPSAQLAARLRQEGVSYRAYSGVAGLPRRMITAFPDSQPDASKPLALLYIPFFSDRDFEEWCVRSPFDGDCFGSSLPHQEGLAVVVAQEHIDNMVGEFSGTRQTPQVLTPDDIPSKSYQLQAISAALRVDALGAKAFKVSRSYFAKGIANKKVFINGQLANKSSQAEPGDEIYAEGIGWCLLEDVTGKTKRGNERVVLKVELTPKRY